MAKYQTKPIEPMMVEAIQLPPSGVDMTEKQKIELHNVLDGVEWESGRDDTLVIHVKGRIMVANPDDWIVKESNGRYTICNPKYFDRTYYSID